MWPRWVGLLVALLLAVAPGLVAQAQTSDDLTSLNAQVLQLYEQARYALAIESAKRSLLLAERLRGSDHPDVATSLMRRGIAWLGHGNAMWLNVIRHNEPAIRFYRRFGCEIDPAAKTAHIVLHVIMRRPPQPLT